MPDLFFTYSSVAHACELRHIVGRSTAEIRLVLSNYIALLIPQIESFDFSPKKIYVEDGMRPSDAREMAESHGGTWWKVSGQYAGVEVETINQPFETIVHWIWMFAAVSGKQDLARQAACLYQLPPSKRLASRDEKRKAILRHALAEDETGIGAFIDQLESGYPAGWPPMVIDFPIGVLKDEPETVLAAVKSVSSKFKSKWDLKKLRRAYERRYGPHDGHYPPSVSWEEWHESSKSAYFGDHWVLAWWALAWLNIARWRGMDGVFENEKVFSEWIPYELCSAGRR